MKTAFQTGPGFFCGFTHKFNRRVDPGQLRLYLARLEAYDFPLQVFSGEDQTQFQVLASMAEGNPELAHALLQLGEHINGNRELLESYARA